MCIVMGIECCERATCTKICEAADEWANSDYRCQVDIPMARYLLEHAAFKNVPLRHNVVRFGKSYEIYLDRLTAKQREVINRIFFDPSGIRQSFGAVAKELGIRKNAVYCRYLGAMRRLAQSLYDTPLVNDIASEE